MLIDGSGLFMNKPMLMLREKNCALPLKLVFQSVSICIFVLHQRKADAFRCEM